jgi:flagellar motor protein MotB
VVTYLLTTGDRGKTKGALARYLRGLVAALEQAQAEYEAEMDRIRKAAEASAEQAAAADEAEEEEDEETEEERSEERIKLAQQGREAMAKKRDALRDKAFEVGFGHLTDRDWKALDAAWRRFVK